MVSFFFVNDTATTEIYTLSLHDALPILLQQPRVGSQDRVGADPPGLVELDRAVGEDQEDGGAGQLGVGEVPVVERSEEHTSELQSRQYLVCRLLLAKKMS